MDELRIRELIESAIEHRRVWPQRVTNFNDRAFMHSNITNSQVEPKDGFINTFIEEISKEKEIQYLATCTFVIDIGMEPLSINEIANWLLARSLKEGVSTAIERLKVVLTDAKVPFLDVLAVCGATPFEPTRLADDITWMPFEQLDGSLAKDFLLHRAEFPVFHMVEGSPYPTPSSAIVREGNTCAQIKPIADAVKEDYDKGANRITQKSEYLLEIARCLALFGVPATPVMFWIQPQDWNSVPGLKMRDARHYLNPEIIPKHSVSVGGGQYTKLISQYLNLEHGIRSKLRVPMERLSLALQRKSPVDIAIELGIALESWLTSDRSRCSHIVHATT